MLRVRQPEQAQNAASRHLSGALLLALVWVGVAPGMLRAQSAAPAPPRLLVPGGPAVTLPIAPAAVVRLAVLVPARSTAILTLRELHHTSLVTWTDAAGNTHTPRTNSAGKDAQIRFTLLGSPPGPQRFAISPSGGKHGSTLEVSVSRLRPRSPRDTVAVSAEEALARAEALWQKHDPHNVPAAEADFDRAIDGFQQLNDVPMLRAGLTWKGYLLLFTAGDARAARPVLLRATGLPDAGDLAEQANSWKCLGFDDATLADYAAAWNDYARALALFARTGDRFNREVLIENRGRISRITGDYEGALHDEEAAATLAREINDNVGILHIDEAIGAIRFQRGDLQGAFEAYHQALRLRKLDPGNPIFGFAETDLARVYQRLGAPAQSRDMFARANAFWAAHPYLVGQVDTLAQQAEAEAGFGDLSESAANYRKALQLAEPTGLKREMVFCLNGLGDVEQRRADLSAASRLYSRASQLATSIDEFDSLARIRISQGDLALRSGNLADAEDRYQKAYEVATRSFDHADAIRALGGLAHVEFRSGRDIEARRHIELALDRIQSTRDRIAPGVLQTGYFSSWHSYYALAIRILMHLNAAHPASGYARLAFETAERARARFLLDQIELGGSRLDRNLDPALAQSQGNTLRRLHLAESTLVSLRARQQNPTRVRELETQVAELKEREDDIESALSRAQSARQSVTAAATASAFTRLFTRLQSRLGPRSALLEYWIDRNSGFLWVLTRTGIRSFRIPGSDQLQPLASAMNKDLQAPFLRPPASVQQFAASLSASKADFDAASLRIDTLILPPHAIPANARTLLVVGDGPLLSIPFGALRMPAARRRPVYLQSRYCVIREPSIAVFLALLDHPRPAHPMKIALFADPVLSPSDPRLSGASASVARTAVRLADSHAPDTRGGEQDDWIRLLGADRLTRLAWAHREAQNIAALAGPDRVRLESGFSASVQRVRSVDWNHFTVAHFATHAFLNPRHPQLASVALSMFNRDGHPQSGFLWFSDISSLHMPVALVVLSACDTAGGDPMPGEGLVGLSYAFFLAGAHRVVGSLWDVDDEATQALMHRFYAALLRNPGSPADALRTAQRELAATPRWSNPYYWAGFTIEGDARSLPH